MRVKSEYCDIFLDRMSSECIWFHVLPEEIANPKEQFENEVFEVKPYYWGEEPGHNTYHFHHKPSGFKIAWYKYPLRGADCNMKLTAEEFYAVIQDCANSLNGGGIQTYYPWWEYGTSGAYEEDNFEEEEFDVAGWISDAGYEDVVVFDNPSYNNAFIGVTTDFRAVYDYDKMIDCLLKEYPVWDEQEAIDFLEYNTIRAAQYIKDGPIVIITR